MKKYLRDAPWGIGMGIGYQNVPANNKYTFMATRSRPTQSMSLSGFTYGVIGITVSSSSALAIMLIGACWIVIFRLKKSLLRGIGAGLCCAFVSMQLGGYGNQVLMQFPNCLCSMVASPLSMSSLI